mmetsp:Transcript_8929/g.13133  ORF Transcript_8929/g.13133 Transcript_8929/m.13133 type:complete len:570 (+) Transcript_8929:214-1923(+)
MPPAGEDLDKNSVIPSIDADDEESDENDILLSLSFNQDGGCLAVGTASGFRICNVHPFHETFRRVFSAGDGTTAGAGGGGIGRVEMLYRTNLLALVGGGPSPRYPPNRVLVYDDHLSRAIGELSFRQRVLNVKLRRDRICVALRDRVYVYNFADLRLLDTIHTCENGLGLLDISTDAAGGGMGVASGGGGMMATGGGMVLACPSVSRGQVRVELYGLRKSVLIDAHENPLAALSLTVDGSLLATASERGTVIRLFETGAQIHHLHPHSNGNSDGHSPSAAGTPIREFRRGVERATVSCLSFSLNGCWLGCASDRGTVHIFKVSEEDRPDHDTRGSSGGKGKHNSSSKKSSASRLAGRLLPGIVTRPKKYLLDGEGSFAQVRGVTNPKLCAFVPDRPRTIAVAGVDEYGSGCLLLASFGEGSEEGGRKEDNATSGELVGKGEAKRVGYYRFFKKGDGGRRRKSKSGRSRNDASAGKARGGDDQDKMDAITSGMNEIVFGDEDEDEGFVSVEKDCKTPATASGDNVEDKVNSKGSEEKKIMPQTTADEENDEGNAISNKEDGEADDLGEVS